MDSSPAAEHHGGRFRIPLPADALVLLVGIAASGKSTFAARHFRDTEVLSSDRLRAVITDDPHAQNATDDAFDLLHRILELRLRRGRLTVIDATNVEGWARAELIAAARRHRRPTVAIVLDVPLEEALRRNLERPMPRPPANAIRRQARWLADSIVEIEHEGHAAVHWLRSVDEVDRVEITRR
jgi:protein phosphatase